MINIEDMSILIVDDMKSMRLTIREMLKNLRIGKTLRFAENGKDALEILRQIKIDLAILDWNMPVMNGFELLGEIRQDKGLRDLPVIMVTAEAERDIVSEAAETEIDGYLLKPLTLAALDDKIKAVIERANNPDEATLHRLKARDLEEAGDYQSAIEKIRLALVKKPNASRLIRELGLLHFKIGKEKIAVKCLMKAASVNRHDTRTRDHLATYYMNKNQLEKAGKIYLEILSLSDRYHDKAIGLAEKLLFAGPRRQAMDIFSKVITRSKKSNAIRERVINICLENNEFEFPQQLLKQEIKEHPSNYDMVFKAGLVSLEAGDYEKALEYFTQVDTHVRGHIDAKLQLAKLYVQKGKIFKADEYLNQILRVEPKNKAAISMRQQL